MSDYTDVIDLLKSEYVEYSGFDFYNYIFPENENAGELHTDYSMPNAIYRKIIVNLSYDSYDSKPLCLCGFVGFIS